MSLQATRADTASGTSNPGSANSVSTRAPGAGCGAREMEADAAFGEVASRREQALARHGELDPAVERRSRAPPPFSRPQPLSVQPDVLHARAVREAARCHFPPATRVAGVSLLGKGGGTVC